MNRKLRLMADFIVCQSLHWIKGKEYHQRRTRKHGEYTLEGFDRLRCIFVHVPKVAGVSINRALFGNLGGGHQTVRAYKRIFGPRVYRKYYSFTFVRNPYSRLVSAYRFLINGGFGEADRTWANANLAALDSFDEFVKKWVSEKSIWTTFHFMPQYSFLCDVLPKPEVDFVGRFESLNEDFNTVCEVLNVQNNLAVYNKGKMDNRNWKELYSDYSLGKVADIYQRDFETFGYSKIVQSGSQTALQSAN